MGSIDVDEQGHPVFGSSAAAEDRRIPLEIVWAALARKYGEEALKRQVKQSAAQKSLRGESLQASE